MASTQTRTAELFHEQTTSTPWCYAMSDDPVVMVRFEMAQRWEALPYLRLRRATFDPSVGISLEFDNATVRVHGNMLDDLFRLLCEHRVSLVRVGNDEFEKPGLPSVTEIRLPPPA